MTLYNCFDQADSMLCKPDSSLSILYSADMSTNTAVHKVVRILRRLLTEMLVKRKLLVVH